MSVHAYVSAAISVGITGPRGPAATCPGGGQAMRPPGEGGRKRRERPAQAAA